MIFMESAEMRPRTNEDILGDDFQDNGLVEKIIRRLVGSLSEKRLNFLMLELEDRILKSNEQKGKLDGDVATRRMIYERLIVQIMQERGKSDVQSGPVNNLDFFKQQIDDSDDISQILDLYMQGLNLVKKHNRSEAQKLQTIIQRVLTPMDEGRFEGNRAVAGELSHTTHNAGRILLATYQRARDKITTAQPEFVNFLPSTLVQLRQSAKIGYHARDLGSKQSEHFRQRDSHIEGYRKALEELKKEKERLGGDEVVSRITTKGAAFSDEELRLLIVHLYLDPNLTRDEWWSAYGVNFNAERSKRLREQLARELKIELPDLRTLRGLRIAGQLE